MRVLVIEDNQALARSLQQGLSSEFVVDLTYTGQKGIYAALTNDYDLVILDLQLPDTTGLDVCQQLRQEELVLPIIVLTGCDRDTSTATLLNAGADDYVTKPYNLVELKARIRAALRKNFTATCCQLLEAGPLKLNLNAKTASINHQPLKLSRKEFLLLQFLMYHPNQTIDQSTLIEHIWGGYLQINSNTLAVHVSQLRKKIAHLTTQPLIITQHGHGYRLEV